MLNQRPFYVTFDENVVRADTLGNDTFTRGKKYLVLDMKEAEHTYHVVFVDDKQKIQMMAIEKFKFAGFVDEEKTTVLQIPGVTGSLGVPITELSMPKPAEKIEPSNMPIIPKPKGKPGRKVAM